MVPSCRSRNLTRFELQEMGYIEQETPVRFRIKEGMVPGMRVPGKFYVNDRLKSLIFDELHAATQRGGQGGFLPAIKQIANVAALPGIVRVSGCIPIYGSLTSWWCCPAACAGCGARLLPLTGFKLVVVVLGRSRSRCRMCTQATALPSAMSRHLTCQTPRQWCPPAAWASTSTVAYASSAPTWWGLPQQHRCATFLKDFPQSVGRPHWVVPPPQCKALQRCHMHRQLQSSCKLWFAIARPQHLRV